MITSIPRPWANNTRSPGWTHRAAVVGYAGPDCEYQRLDGFFLGCIWNDDARRCLFRRLDPFGQNTIEQWPKVMCHVLLHCLGIMECRQVAENVLACAWQDDLMSLVVDFELRIGYGDQPPVYA
jgi:hypothetical protein